jgi:uncharacterized membrane protein (DUF485 family)
MNLQYHLNNPAFAAMYNNAPTLEPVLATPIKPTVSTSNSISMGEVLFIAGGIAVVAVAIYVIHSNINNSKNDREYGN